MIIFKQSISFLYLLEFDCMRILILSIGVTRKLVTNPEKHAASSKDEVGEIE